VRTYDEYSNDEWHNTSVSERGLLPYRSMPLAPDTEQWPTAEFTFTVRNRLYFLATPKQPVWISRPVTLIYLPVTDTSLDPLLISVDPAIQAGEAYTVYAAVASPNVIQLRAAGSGYPLWVTSRYLQLPENFPQEIADLAQQISANASTPFDKASAITNYLRLEIRYNRSIPPAPSGEDPLAWFLFTSKEGFCNYYASAEVLMLRSIGIPARMAVGFSNGERQVPYQRIVRQRDAHAWPEVYFPGIGWVEFEPTASELPITRPVGETDSMAGEDGTPVDRTPEEDDGANAGAGGGAPGDRGNLGSGTEQSRFQRVIIILLVALASTTGIVMLVLAGLGKKKRQQIYATFQTPPPILLAAAFEKLSLPIPAWLRRWVRWSKLGSVERSFQTVHRSLYWLGVQSNPARTPAESAARLTSLLPDAAGDIQTLLHEYQLTLFGPHSGNATIAREAAKSLKRVSLRAAVQGPTTARNIGRQRVPLRGTKVQPRDKNN
jgi:transglutaminase-like putative cysteine protease